MHSAVGLSVGLFTAQATHSDRHNDICGHKMVYACVHNMIETNAVIHSGLRLRFCPFRCDCEMPRTPRCANFSRLGFSDLSGLLGLRPGGCLGIEIFWASSLSNLVRPSFRMREMQSPTETNGCFFRARTISRAISSLRPESRSNARGASLME